MMDTIALAIINQMIEEASEAADELKTHIETINPDVGRGPERRARAEEWVSLAEVGGADAN